MILIIRWSSRCCPSIKAIHRSICSYVVHCFQQRSIIISERNCKVEWYCIECRIEEIWARACKRSKSRSPTRKFVSICCIRSFGRSRTRINRSFAMLYHSHHKKCTLVEEEYIVRIPNRITNGSIGSCSSNGGDRRFPTIEFHSSSSNILITYAACRSLTIFPVFCTQYGCTIVVQEGDDILAFCRVVFCPITCIICNGSHCRVP